VQKPWLSALPFGAITALLNYVLWARPGPLGAELSGLASRAQLLRLGLAQAGLAGLVLALSLALGASSYGALVPLGPARLRVQFVRALLLSWATLLVSLLLSVRALPVVLTLPLPAWAALIGVALGAARFRESRRSVLLGAFVLLATPVLGLCAAAALAVESEPRSAELPPLAPDARRAILASFHGKNPRKIPAGELRTVTLAAPEAEALVGWLADAGLRARARLTLTVGGFRGDASIPLPRGRGWLNVALDASLGFADGHFHVDVHSLRVGALPLPSRPVDVLIESILAALQQNRDVGTIVGALARLELTPERALVSYGRLDAERGLFARLVWGAEEQEVMREEVDRYVDELSAAMAASPAGDARFAAALGSAFARGGRSLEGRREALIALGIVLGHRGLGRFVGLRLEGPSAERVDQLRAGTSLRGRDDWARHFAVSGALTALADTAPSDAVGLLKEQLDSDGGSGFSFGDLLADRAGTRFAERLLGPHGEDLAVRVAERAEIASLMPEAAGLPEGIPEQEFLASYGGLEGERSKRLLAEIEARLDALPP
jgi:hypothetical protein